MIRSNKKNEQITGKYKNFLNPIWCFHIHQPTPPPLVCLLQIKIDFIIAPAHAYGPAFCAMGLFSFYIRTPRFLKWFTHEASFLA